MGKLFEELKCRKVFRIAAVYAVVAWVLIQVSDVVLPTFGTPSWVNQTIICLFILGFLPTLIAAWAYELTPDGIRPDLQSRPQEHLAPSADRKLIYATFVLVLLVAGFQVVDRFFLTGQQQQNQTARSRTSTQNLQVIRFNLPLSEEEALFLGGPDTFWGRPSSNSVTFSRQGDLLIYSAWTPGTRGQNSHLYLRSLDQEQATLIEGTEGASGPFLSPDGMWIGFYQDSSLRRIPLAGGIAQTIVADTVDQSNLDTFEFRAGGATWGDDGTIIYGDATVNPLTRGALYRVADSGGIGELLVDPASSMGQFDSYTQPHLLPGSEVLLFHGTPGLRSTERSEIIAMNLTNGDQKSLVTNAMDPRYIAELKLLLFMRQAQLMAVRFNPENLAIEGAPVIVADDIMQAINSTSSYRDSGVGQLSFSQSGHLVFVTGGIFPERVSTLARVTLDGEVELLDSVSLATKDPRVMRLSPGGNLISFTSQSRDGRNIFIHDLDRDVTQQINTGSFTNGTTQWSPDGEFIAFEAIRQNGVYNIYRIAVNGSSEQPQPLAPSTVPQFIQSWSSDGAIAYLQEDDIWILPEGGQPTRFVFSGKRERDAVFSPNGDWLAYSVWEEDLSSSEVYVRPYPGPAPSILISGAGSRSPAWSKDGTQLYFLQTNEGELTSMMVVDIVEGNPSPARMQIDNWPYSSMGYVRNFDIREDGTFITTVDEQLTEDDVGAESVRADINGARELKVVLNFFELLRQQLGID